MERIKGEKEKAPMATIVKDKVLDLRKSDVLKLMAIITMLIDHMGYFLYPEFIEYRIIGRVSFPVFAYLIAYGADKTRDIKQYLYRLLLFAIISQPIYSLVFHTKRLNIFFTLSLGLLCIFIYKEKKNIILPLIFTMLGYFIDTSYGHYGVLLIFMFYLFKDRYIELFLIFVLLNGYYGLIQSPGNYVQAFSLMALPFIYIGTYLNKIKFGLNKYIYYGFYPLHLLILYLIKIH